MLRRKYSAMTHTLYYSPGACSLAVHIVLGEVGARFELTLVSASDGSTQSPEYLRLNPKGRVPVLVTGDFVLTEAPAILIYLASAYPAAHLLNASVEALVKSVEWFNWLSGTVHAVAVRQVWRPERFTLDPTAHAAIVGKGEEGLHKAFTLIDTRLGIAEWCVGDHYSIVDAYLLVFYRWGNRMGVPMRDRYPEWTKHMLRLLQRAAVQRALDREAISVWQ
jgi:glutathione S-transferase